MSDYATACVMEDAMVNYGSDMYDPDEVDLYVECDAPECSWSGYEDELTVDGRCPKCGCSFSEVVASQ